MMKKTIAIALVLASACAALAEGLDIQKLAQDTQRYRHDKSQVDMIWWIPSEYWQAAFKANPVITPEQQTEFIRVVDDYLVLCVLEGTIGPFGGISGTAKEQLLAKTSAVVDGHTLKPLADEELSNDARNFFQMMKPMFANMMGQIGQGMEFVVFKGKNEEGRKYVNPVQKGFLTVRLGDKEFKYRLPLGCFLPPKYDPKTGEEFPGNYIYSPFTGTELQTTKPNKTNGGDGK